MTSSANKSSTFQTVQHVFTQHMRDPEHKPAPAGIEDRRMKIYRDLIYNNIQNFIGNSFPVVRKIIPDEEWHQLMRDYVRDHQAQTPLFPKMPQEFIKYLQASGHEILSRYPFLLELAHYEWIETSVSLDNRELDFTAISREGDLLSSMPVLNPLAVPLAYQWPVHTLGPDTCPDEAPAQPTFIVVYRKPDFDVSFMILNDVSARLIEKLQHNEDANGREILTEIARELQHPDVETVITGGLTLMQDMRERYVLLGTR